MKRLLYLFLISFSVTSVCCAQNPTTLDGWAERLRLFGEKIPQEEIFVHTDNTCYYLGDTLYFKAYMRLSDGHPSHLSKMLYVELLNQDGYLVERQKIEMKDGMGFGSFCLLDTLYGGYYELRAYTRWQLNWGQYEHDHTKNAEEWFFSKKMMHEYYRDYDKLYSRVFPVYDKPCSPGDYAQDMTMRPLRRQIKQKEDKPTAVVRFYPEGGNLVAGVPNRVAFEVNDEEGKHLKGKLTVKSEQLSLNVEAETQSRGRGSFVITPPASGTLKGTFEWEGRSQIVELPKTVPDGVALQATVTDDGIHVRLHRAGVAAMDTLGLTASCHGLLKDFQTLDGNETQIPLSKLPTGVIQLTVFNAEGRIFADRLVFVRQPGFQPQSITFSELKDQYEPYSPVELSVQCTAAESPSISLAVRDALHSDYTFDTGNMLTEMLLASQIKGFVEQPEYFFEQDDEERRTALDLLLMVQGWRRYDWVEMATPGAFTLEQPYERTEILLGEVNKYEAEIQEDAVMAAMDAHEQAYAADQSYLEDRISQLQGEDQSEFSEGSTGALTTSTLQADTEGRFNDDETNNGTTRRTNSTAADERSKVSYKDKRKGNLKDEAFLHAEFLQPGVKQGESAVVGEMDTYDNGLFRIEAPRFYVGCYFSYAAIKKDKWKGENHIWVDVNEDAKGRINYPSLYAKLTLPYPRFVKPYNFYQKNLPTARVQGGRKLYVDDKAILLNEVTVGSRRSGLRSFDASKPAFVIDAYDAFNDVCDAGFCPGYFIGANRFALDLARTYIGDMNLERAYPMELRFNSKNTSSIISPVVLEKYNHLPNLDMVYIYTDYSPRMEGNSRYSQDNQPVVTVDLRRFEDNSQRMTWRDRRMFLSGYAICEDFYQPDYSTQKPASPIDYRRTLYWNPNVEINADGMGKIRFFTGSRPVSLIISAEGMSATGEPLTGIRYPEE